MQNNNLVLFQQIGHIAEDVYFIFDNTRGLFNYISPAFETVWGQPANEMLNNPTLILNTIGSEDKMHIRAFYSTIRNSAEANKIEFRIVCPDKSEKYILLKVYPVLYNSVVNLLAGIAEDISVIKKNIFNAEKINARKNSTLAILAHDFKGSIGLINLMASTIKKEISIAGNERLLKPVQFIQDLCNRNIDIISNLIDQEFLESPEVDLRKERADLVGRIDNIIQNYKKSEEVFVKKFILTSSAEKLYIQMDTLKMMRAVNNLITNAIKFTPENGVIEVDIKDMDTLVQITVHDNGIGIPENLQPYLFDKFTRSRRTGLQGEEPIGLGMSIIKTIVELHDGRIWFDTKENKGSSFYIEIPKF